MQEDEETLCRFGTALPAFEEDAVPSKKPITVEDQIVLDSNGKRRFHGAFTGGFSAGYWNTVGSEEGWKPTEFKSSRTEKSAVTRQQNPMDFMDEEDLGEFGIAPQRVQTREDFAANSGGSGAQRTTSNKRRLDMGFSKGPIPGQPVLRALLEPAREKTAVKILKQMGWREGQGIGERQTRGEKKRANERTCKEQYLMKMYGCEIPGRTEQTIEQPEEDDGSEDSESDYEITFAPDDFDPLVAALKDNAFGLGYSGLDRGESSKGFRLFDTLELVDRNNKKLSIRGQAFGIGALEDDDDLDVYARDDMSRYDFSLEDKKQSKQRAIERDPREANTLEGFRPQTAGGCGTRTKTVFRVAMPDHFRPRNWEERRSRFDPLDEERAKKIQRENEHKIRGLGRHDLDPKERGEILGENRMITSNPVLEMINRQSSNFVRREVIDESKETRPVEGDAVPVEVKQQPPSSIVPSGLVQQPKVLERQYIGSTKEGFKPFIAVPEKQERYERFLAFQPTERYLTREQYLESLQPLNLSSWDRERELKEFLQAERMYRPLDGLMSERFVTASSLIADKTITDADGEPGKPREIRMQRTRVMWKPHKELCKRFNVPEPFGGMMVDEPDAVEKRRKGKGKFSVFDYLETPVTNRRDFVTPSVIPSNVQQRPPAAEGGTVGSSTADKTPPTGQRLSSKDFFLTDTTVDPPSVATAINPNANPVSSKPPSTQQPTARIVHKKRTELEEKVLQASNQKPEEKRDLFKSIFCSSDEEETTEPVPAEKSPATDQSTLTDKEKLNMVDSFMAIKPASQLNVLRNDSPPRGIFKNLFEFKKPRNGDGKPSERSAGAECVVPSSSSKEDRIADAASVTSSDSDPDSDTSDTDDAGYYGPKLPTSHAAPLTKSDSSKGGTPELDARLQHLLGGRKEDLSGEVWIEKNQRSSSDKSKKKKKKHKQHHHKSKTKSKKEKKDKKRSHKQKSKR
uniref:G-patch domain-containing protein n=1 Tax=Anopheles farauti TaxID=69004 RepID=A0A182QSF9_9DIPT